MFLMVMCIVLLSASNVCNGRRRIVDGEPLSSPKRYVAYFVAAAASPRKYDSWLCGGAIVTPVFIVTSAACVEDVKFLYAIAGYNKYVPHNRIHENECTSRIKKKVVYTCKPTAYELNYTSLDKWSYIDIAMAKVESPYDFDDKNTYHSFKCSYTPGPIKINYDEKYQRPGTDALVFGWGHKEIWRKPNDTTIYNQEQLLYAPVVLIAKAECVKGYQSYRNMANVIRRYMICSDGMGNIDDQGEQIKKPSVDYLDDGCKNDENDGGVHVHDGNNYYFSRNKYYNNRRRDRLLELAITTQNDSLFIDEINYRVTHANQSGNPSRKHGICQNDHGGPIVTWRGSKEILIGISSVFKVSPEYKCIGPYLFTSTQCNGLFLNCVLTMEHEKTRRSSLCDGPAILRGFNLVQKTISWQNHPDGARYATGYESFYYRAILDLSIQLKQ